MCFYGEVLFLLSGLKPTVLFSNLPAPRRQSFVSDVITPSGILQHTTSDCIPALYTVGIRVETPAEYDMSGDLVLINKSLADLFAAAKVSLRLVKVQRTTVEAVSSGNQSHLVNEDVLARLLDYPVALSECREPMVEQSQIVGLVGYNSAAHSAIAREELPEAPHEPLPSMSASYNDWESDLSSIIEKTNQNLKLLRRIGEKRTDDVTTTGRPSASSVGNTADLRTAVHHRYAAEDAAASYRPRVLSSASSSTNRKLASTMGDPRGRGNEPTAGLRASVMMDARRGDTNYDSDDLHAARRSLRRTTSRGGESTKPLKASTSAGPPIRVHEADMPSDVPNYVLDEIKKSLEVTISSRSSAFEKKIGDLRTDFTVLTNETTQLSHKFAELRDSVLSKMSNVPGVLQSLQENVDAITRLEKHSAALLGWKVSMEQDFFEITSKVKSFTTLQDKMAALESNLENLATALKNRPRHDEKIEQLSDKLSVVERHQSNFVDVKAVENMLNIRLPRELHDLEGRANQSIAFVSEKVESKIQSLEKSLQSQRADSMASLRSELSEDIQRLSATSLRKSDIVPLQNVHAQLKEDLSQVNSFLDRQEKRIQDFKQSSTQIREELVETKQELTKALHAQQSRVAATLEDKIAQLGILAKEKNVRVDQQMESLSKKQKKVEADTKVLHADIAKVRQDALSKHSATHVAQQEENEKLRQRLARSVAELETLTFAKVELERRYEKQEKQFQVKLKTLHAKLEENEKLKESERIELVQRIQEETKLMGIAQGKNALLEVLLSREKLQNTEKNDLIHKSRQEMNLVRQKMRSLENDVEIKMHKLTTELHSKQGQVDTLLKKLKRSEEDAAKLLENTKRDTKAFRRAKVTKEHELSIAKLKLKEMEKAAASAMLIVSQPNSLKEEAGRVSSDVLKRDAEEAESKRKEMERLLLESQLQVDELNQEITEIQRQHDAAERHQSASLEAQVSKLSSEYEAKIVALNAAVTAKDHAMLRLRDSLVEKSELEALDEQLRALMDEKQSLLATIERDRVEQSRAIQDHDAKSQLTHDKEMKAMKLNLEVRVQEIDEARSVLDQFKASVSRLEIQLKDQESSHSEELSSLESEIKGARTSIAACTSEIKELRMEKSQLEHELESVQTELENARSEADDREAEMNDRLAERETEMQSKLEEISNQLGDKESELADSKRADEANRHRLGEMVSEQEAMERRLKSEIESFSLALDHERENSKTREQESESAMLALQNELDVVKLDSQAAKTVYQSTMATEIADITRSLEISQLREQQLQQRLVRILKEVAQASSAFNADTQADITGSEDDDIGAVKYLSHFCATQRATLLELENLQTDYEMAVSQSAESAATIQELEAQVNAHCTQIQDLQAVVKKLETELKEQYASSAKQSEDWEYEIAALRKQKVNLERVVETKLSEYDEKQALFDRQLESKQDQVEGLRCENEKLSATIESIRSKMERIEVAKARELDEMSLVLTELEAQTAAHSVKTQDGADPELDKEFYAAHHETVALSHSIRSLQLKLTKSVGVLEWNDLRASMFEHEDKLERLRREKSREVAKLGSAEDEILLNADFLKAILALKESGECYDSSEWASKYVKTAPDMVKRLRRLESRLQEAFVPRTSSTGASLAGLESSVLPQSSRSHDDLSESCESNEFLEESHEDLEHNHELGEEQSFEGSLGESEILSDSEALHEASLEINLAESAPEPSSHGAIDEVNVSRSHEGGRPSTSAVVSGDLERVDSCTTLLSANAPPELLSTPFVTSPTRHFAQALSAESIGDGDVAHSHGEFNDARERDSDEPSAELQDPNFRVQAADNSLRVANERGSQHDAAAELPSVPRATVLGQSDESSGSEFVKFSAGTTSNGVDLHDGASEDEESDDEHSLDSHASEERSPPLDDIASIDESDHEEHATEEPAHGDLHQIDPMGQLTTRNGVDQGQSDRASERVLAKPSVEVLSTGNDLHDEASCEDSLATHSITTSASASQAALRDDSAPIVPPQPSSDKASETAQLTSNAEPAVVAVTNSSEHFGDATRRDEENGDWDDQSQNRDSAAFDSSVESEGLGNQASLARGSKVPSLNSPQHAHEDDQELCSVDSEQESDDDDKDCNASDLALDHDEDDDFKGYIEDNSFPDAAFDSHESDEENLSEFELLQSENSESRTVSAPDKGLTADSSHNEEEEHFAVRSITYHMEEDEGSDEDDIDEVERMLLAEAADEHGGDLNQFQGEPFLDESDGEGINESDGSERYDAAKSLLGGDKLHASSCDFDEEDEVSIDASHDDETARSGSDEPLERSLDHSPVKLKSAEADLELEESHEDDRNDTKLPVTVADRIYAQVSMEQQIDGRLQDDSGDENDGLGGEELLENEDLLESSFDQASLASSVSGARNDQSSAHHQSTIDSGSSPVVSGSLGGRSALLKHMSFSRAQTENEDESDDMNEVEQLVREQSGFAVQKPVALTSHSNVRKPRDDQEEANNEDKDDLIDSDSECEDGETSLDASCDEVSKINECDASPGAEADEPSSDEVRGGGVHAVCLHEPLPNSHSEMHQRLDENQISADEAEDDEHDESLGDSQNRFTDDSVPASSELGRDEAVESSFDEQLLKALDTDHEDSTRLSNGGAIADSSESGSESESVDDDEEEFADGESADHHSSILASLSAPTQSHIEEEQEIVQTEPNSSFQVHQDGDFDDGEGEFDFGSQRMESSLPAAPIKLQSSQLAPLIQLSSLSSGSDALNKALSAATRDFDDEGNDDVEAVERLMTEKSVSRVSSKRPIGSFGWGHEAQYDAADGVEFSGAPKKALSAATQDCDDGADDDVSAVERLVKEKSIARVSSKRPISSFGWNHEAPDEFGAESVTKSHSSRDKRGDDFEEHELHMSTRDDHDESFGGSDEFFPDCNEKETRSSRARLGESTDNSVGADEVAETHAGGDFIASDNTKRSHAASDDEESEEKKFDARHSSAQKSSVVSTRSATTLDRNPGGFGVGRHMSLEEDEDIDEVERLLLEQTSMKQQPLKQATSTATGANDDDEFGEASVGELMDAGASNIYTEVKSNMVDVHRDQTLDESHDSDQEQGESLDTSQQESSFDAAPAAANVAASATMKRYFDDEQPKSINRAVLGHHNVPRHHIDDGGAISDSSDSEDEAPSRQLHSPAKANTTTTSLPSLGLGTKVTGLGFSRRTALEEDDDMDEVERLLMEQTSMKQQSNVNKLADQATSLQHDSENESDDDDEFGEESIGALMDEHSPGQQLRASAINTLQPIKAVERPQQQERSYSSGFADDAGGEVDNEGVEERSSPSRRLRDLDQADSASSSPSASSTRIPIFNGSNLADRVATDAIPTMLTGQQSLATTTASVVAVESEIQQQLQQLETGDSEGEEEYLEESFDLEESMPDEEDD